MNPLRRDLPMCLLLHSGQWGVICILPDPSEKTRRHTRMHTEGASVQFCTLTRPASATRGGRARLPRITAEGGGLTGRAGKISMAAVAQFQRSKVAELPG
jgi:hypothetical protein